MTIVAKTKTLPTPSCRRSRPVGVRRGWGVFAIKNISFSLVSCASLHVPKKWSVYYKNILTYYEIIVSLASGM
jgi:hypothetical protein